MSTPEETTDATPQFDNWMDGLKALADQFEEENEDLEAILAGDIGLFGFYTEDGDVTRGAHVAILKGIYEQMEEVSIDDDILEINHGEVTPEAARDELDSQLRNFGLKFGGRTREKVLDEVEDHVRSRMGRQEDVAADGGTTLGDYQDGDGDE